jgi:Protein of unknown function (DUF2510)
VAIFLILIVGGVLALGVVAGVIVYLVRLADSPKSTPYVPHSWQQPTSAPLNAPGWYPDNTDPNLVRYFDGGQWTSATRPRD